MSQEGANLPQEVDDSHDKATASHGDIPASVESPMATMIPVGSNSSSVSKIASTVNNAGLSKHASPVVLSADEDNAKVSKIVGPAVLLAVEEKKVDFKVASPTVLSSSEKHNDVAGSKHASPAMLHGSDNNKARAHAGVDNNTARSKLAGPAVPQAGDDNNDRSKIAGLIVPHAIVDNTTGSKLNSPPVLHAGKDMDNNAGRPKFASPLLRAGANTKARTKLAIQVVSHAGSNIGPSRLTRSAAALHAAKDNVSKFAIQAVPHPHASKGNNAGSSKAAKSMALDIGESNTKEGKDKIASGEQRTLEADVGGSSRKGNTTAVESADHDVHVHIFTERERRKKMKNMFSTLHGLLPHLPNKADKATIVGEAVTYIKTLEGTLQKLEKLKMERRRAQVAQQQQQVAVAVGAGGSSSSYAAASAARQPIPPALPAPAPAAPSREASLADMVHGLEAQQATEAAMNRTLAAVAMAAAMVDGSSSSSGSGTAAATAALPRGAVPFLAPEAGFQTWTGQNVVVSVANNEAYINLHIPRQRGALTKALFVLERHGLRVLTTTVSADDGFRMYNIHVRANPPASASVARFPENQPAEERFKLAVAEIMQLINGS